MSHAAKDSIPITYTDRYVNLFTPKFLHFQCQETYLFLTKVFGSTQNWIAKNDLSSRSFGVTAPHYLTCAFILSFTWLNVFNCSDCGTLQPGSNFFSD